MAQRVGVAAGLGLALAGGFYTAYEVLETERQPAAADTRPPPTFTRPNTETTGTGSATEPPPPPVTPTFTRPDAKPSPDEVDAALAKLKRANAVFNAPRTLRLHEQIEIQLLVSVGQSIASLKREITAPGKRKGAPIEVSNVMIATLSGSGFSIDPDEESEQIVARRGYTTWSWDVEPIRTGTQYLRLRLFAVITFEGREKRYMVKRFEEKLTINVTLPERFSEFFKSNWQWLWTTLLVPIAGFVWSRRNQSKKEGGTRKRKRGRGRRGAKRSI